MEQLKITRRNRKGSLTRAMRELNSLLKTNASKSDIETAMCKAKKRFEAVEDSHNELVQIIENEDLYEAEQKWMNDCQDDFIAEIAKFNDMLTHKQDTRPTVATGEGEQSPDTSRPIAPNTSTDSSNTSTDSASPNTSNDSSNTSTDSARPNTSTDSSNTSTDSARPNTCTEPSNASANSLNTSTDTANDDNLARLIKTISLPKVQIKPYEGDPLYYHAFIASFSNWVTDMSNADIKLNTLLSVCAGKALESIQYCVLKPPSEGYKAALKTLKERFGNTAVIVHAWVNKIVNRQRVDAFKLSDFADDLENCLQALTSLNYVHELNNQASLKQIIEKLPKFLQNRWQRENYRLKEKGNIPSLQDVVKFVRAAAMEVNDPVFGTGNVENTPNTAFKSKKNQVNNASVSAERSQLQSVHRPSKCWICKSNEHWPEQCEKLSGMKVEDRWEFMKANHACYSCLKVAGRNHRMSNCSRKRVCGKQQGDVKCDKFHHKLLHLSRDVGSVSQVSLKNIGEPLLNVLEVNVLTKHGNIPANVMLDTGSQGTFVREQFAKQLGQKGRSVSAQLTKFGGSVESFQSKVFEIQLEGSEPQVLHKVNALEVPDINSVRNTNVGELEKAFNMTNGTRKRRSGSVDILIGVDYAHLHTGKSIQSGDLVAQKTPLGWTVYGGLSTGQREGTVMHIKVSKTVDLTDFWATEAMGIDINCSCKGKSDMLGSMEGKLIEDSCIKVSKRWMISYPWARNPTNLSDNREQAKMMLKGLEKRLKKNREMSATYNQQMEELVKLGFARKLSNDEIEEYNGPVHYVPHHPVIRKDKKSTPLRIVFNASSKHNGETLNDYWMKGPDLLNNLPGVILRFRENPNAISGDIEKMYHQVLIPELDQHVHRYLWRNLEEDREPDTYIKTVLTFGDKPAPAMALTALKMTAKESRDSYPEAAKVLTRDTYVDDICTSVTSIEQGKKLTQDLDSVLKQGGFNIKEWLSNEDLGVEKGTKEESVHIAGKSTEEKVLGIQWDRSSDNLVICVKLDKEMVTADNITKRNALSVIAKVFDPVGFVAPVVVKLKMKMQDLWKANVEWDELLPHDVQQEWRKCFEELQRVNNVKIPRCLTPPDGPKEVSLIVFCDASERAFGACAYFWWKINNDEYETRFISAKSRVAPVKKLTIPRLELQAAVMAARMGASIADETNFQLNSKIFMTDSMITLAWIRKPASCYKQFVAARVSEIQRKTNIDEWRYIPGTMNPADDVSRGITAESLQNRWLKGPSFLKQPTANWPQEPMNKVQTDEESRVQFCGKVDATMTDLETDITGCQTWDEMVTKYQEQVPEDKGGPMTAGKLENIELMLLRRTQKECFGEEYHVLKQGKCVPESSRLANLNPQFDSESTLIRVGGRLRNAQCNEIDVHPILLDPNHLITRLLVQRIDNDVFNHSAGHEQIFAYVRRRYWILRARSMIKGVIRKCLQCQKWRKQPKAPIMADLPSARLRVGKPVFYSTGMDCFGPYLIKIGRRREKRWVVIFKCMTTRAVHLELTGSMDADAFIMAFRRFISRRGKPKELFSDCGTNFKGADQELRNCFKSMSGELQEKLAKQQVEFKFNPPSAPHFGGVWEREIKSVKNALRCCLKDRIPYEAVLQTVVAEVEGLVNSKPLGYASSDISDVDPITPNLLMMGRRDPQLPAISFDIREELSSKKQWRHSQVIIDLFWKKYVSDYLSNLQVRQKWSKESDNLKVKDRVLIVDNKCLRGEWAMGEVVKVFPSQDKRVRVVDIKVGDKIYKRPVVKLIKLDEWH